VERPADATTTERADERRESLWTFGDDIEVEELPTYPSPPPFRSIPERRAAGEL
jgi:hypothetical protein